MSLQLPWTAEMLQASGKPWATVEIILSSSPAQNMDLEGERKNALELTAQRKGQCLNEHRNASQELQTPLYFLQCPVHVH